MAEKDLNVGCQYKYQCDCKDRGFNEEIELRLRVYATLIVEESGNSKVLLPES